MLRVLARTIAGSLFFFSIVLGQTPPLRMALAEYEDRVHAAWLGEIGATPMGFQFEHKPAAVVRVEQIPGQFKEIPVDDDYYYELVALRGFEKYGPDMTVRQLGQQWKENAAGSWGSSEQARLLLLKGVQAPDTGHPRYNRLWFSIGPQFSAEIYGMLAPDMPNVAAKLARQYGHVNGYAEGVDGAVFMAGMVSLAFIEKDPRQIVRKAAQLIDASSPYRQCLDMIIAMAEKGGTAEQVRTAVEDRWHIEYSATNNAVPNGGIVAAAVWFGEGDFLQTVNHAFRGGDFTDADCNAANAGTVIGIMRGMKGLPAQLVARLDIAHRNVLIGAQFITRNGGTVEGATVTVATQNPEVQPAERFELGDLMQFWNPDWTLLRAGVRGAGGGMKGLRGNTYLDGKVLATYPRDEVRGLVLRRQLTLGANPKLSFEVAADEGRAWRLDVCADNEKVFSQLIRTSGWQPIEVNLQKFSSRTTVLRLFQRVLLGQEFAPGNAYWKKLKVE